MLERAAAEFERLGVAHLAEYAKARRLAAAGTLCQTFRMPVISRPDGARAPLGGARRGPDSS